MSLPGLNWKPAFKMRFAIFSDIHSNMDALTAVLAEAMREGVDRIISLGDNIGYGPEPEPVMRALDTHGVESVLGNHELALVNPDFLKGFNPQARKALEINRQELSPASLRKIESLPAFLSIEGARFVHGVPPDLTARYIHKESLTRLGHIMEAQAESLSFVGHTHQLAVYGPGPSGIEKRKLGKSRVSLAKKDKYIINSGSVGQPRSSHNEAVFVIWESRLKTIEARFVPYDAARTIRLIKEKGIPRVYGDLLELGSTT